MKSTLTLAMVFVGGLALGAERCPPECKRL